MVRPSAPVLSAAVPDDLGSGGVFVLIVSVVLVVVGMARPPLIPDLFWRLVCWSAAVLVGEWWLQRANYLPGGYQFAVIGAASVLVLASLFLLEVARTQRSTKRRSPALDITVAVGQRVVELPIADSGDSSKKIGTFFWIHDVRIWNRSTTDGVSLDLELILPIQEGKAIRVEQKGFLIVPSYFTGRDRLLECPIDIGPQRAGPRGDLGFTLMASEEDVVTEGRGYGAVARMADKNIRLARLRVHDRISGQEITEDISDPKLLLDSMLVEDDR